MVQAPDTLPTGKPKDNSGIDLDAAINEVKEVQRHVTASIDRIISIASAMEKFLGHYVFAEKERLEEGVTKILEACSVQDITSQRIHKVLEFLGDGEALAKKNRQQKNAKSPRLESGPQLPASAMSQADIDKLLNS